MDLKKCENNNKNNNNEEGTEESVKGQRAVAPLTLIIFDANTQHHDLILKKIY